MVPSFQTLHSAAQSRAFSAPLRRTTPASALPETALEGLRQRNSVLDALFYDIGNVTSEEASMLGVILAAEGALLLVPPTGGGHIRCFDSVEDYVGNGGASVKVLAVAGVGSSALGSAAFARNIADALGEPVCAVVSGYGLADALTEGLGGFLWFGALNRLRHGFEWLDRLREQGVIAEPTTALTAPPMSASPLARWSKDVKSVAALLQRPDLEFSLLTGHSKGNLVLSEALFALKQANPAQLARIGARTRIVTVSAQIAMPPACKSVIDVMGALDGFGLMNSTPGIRTDRWVPMAWHHTNSEHPLSLKVTPIFAALVAEGLLP